MSETPPPPVDVAKTLRFGQEKFLVRQIPFALGLVALGAFSLFVVGGEGALPGLILMVAGLGMIGFALVRDAKPGRPIYVLSPEGFTWNFGARSIFIPWQEVQGLGVAHVSLSRRASFNDVPCLLVTEDHYRRKLHIGSFWQRGPYWDSFFQSDGDLVQVAVIHDYAGVSGEEMFNELDARWRAFSGHPAASRPGAPYRATGDFVGAMFREAKNAIPAPVRRVGLYVLAALALLLVYFHNFFLAHMARPDFNAAQREAYVRDVIDKIGLPARLPNGEMAVLRRADIRGSYVLPCERRTARDRSARGFMPAYATIVHCRVDARLASGGWAVGIFRIAVEEHEYGRAWVSGVMPLDEADRRLCAMGFCAPGVRPPEG